MVWTSGLIEQPVAVEGYGYGVLVFGLAAVTELSAEPLWLMGQVYQHVGLKVIVYQAREVIGYHGEVIWTRVLTQG